MTVHAQTPILCNLLYSIGDFVLKFGFIKSHFKNRIPRFNISYLNTKQSRLSTLSFCITISPEGTGFHLSNIKPAPSGGLAFIAQQARPLGRASISTIHTYYLCKYCSYNRYSSYTIHLYCTSHRTLCLLLVYSN